MQTRGDRLGHSAFGHVAGVMVTTRAFEPIRLAPTVREWSPGCIIMIRSILYSCLADSDRTTWALKSFLFSMGWSLDDIPNDNGHLRWMVWK
ncbi:hypothetical protein NPIL_360901 [Nephila pilipes]|uniref:Uncharacterized protein n=1 Tax=Nephila pilipes TaxID=299642 RepID=A0A8X6TTQ5_NEPPI|nr:hypothetical protein NPIL_360901 [Nephila pilipes]